MSRPSGLALGIIVLLVVSTACDSSEVDESVAPPGALDVVVDVPDGWAEGIDCPGDRQHGYYGPDGRPCDDQSFIDFYDAGTYDTSAEPGVGRHGAVWSGFRILREPDVVVYVSDPDRAVVEAVLKSARATG